MIPMIELGILIIIIVKLKMSSSVNWDQVKCSSDAEQSVPEGRVPIGRFPWLGVVQHTFYLGEQAKFAVTTGVLIHPGYAIASADDMARVSRAQMFNNTKFILWHSDELKFVLDVQGYLLHPEYEEKATFSTLALLELITYGETGISDYPSVALPVCMPVSGIGTFDQLYSVRFSDEDNEIHKELNKMNYITDTECEEYYEKAGLSDEKMKPRRPLCASVESQKHVCVWDAGAALITRQTWGHWMILGFSMRGAGCGAPSRFVNIHDFLGWIDDVITKISPEQMDKTIRLEFRRQNPYSFTMYAADVKLPKQEGQCLDKKQRGSVLFKEDSELLTTRNFAQGFYFVSAMQVASVMCIQVELDVVSRTNAAVWVEHLCIPHGAGSFKVYWWGYWRGYRKSDCFMYYNTKAYAEVRFYFSFRAILEVTFYGKIEKEKFMPDPFNKYETTLPWLPTGGRLHQYLWHPVHKYQWSL